MTDEPERAMRIPREMSLSACWGSLEDDLATQHRTASDPGRGPRLHCRQFAGFRFVERADAYGFVRRVLVRTRYVRLSESDKGLVRRFLVKVTGFSRAQISRLISQYRATGRIEDRRRGPKRPFPRRYTEADIGLLAEVDETLGGL